jgi:membrane-anchored protein YejM (alkaline phosphatase superfamily)
MYQNKIDWSDLLTMTHFQQKMFQHLCMDLLKVSKEGGPTHNDKIDEIRQRFPKAKRWLDWWSMACWNEPNGLQPKRQKESNPDQKRLATTFKPRVKQ